MFRSLMRDRATIFMLHRKTNPALGISGHTPEFLRQALQSLRRSGAEFVSLRTLVDCWKSGDPGQPNWVVFTIDDGFADQGEFVTEVFVPANCPVTVFLITGFLDGQLWPWDDQLASIFKNAAAQTAQLTLDSHRIDVDLTSSESRTAALRATRAYCKIIENTNLYDVVRDIGAQLRTTVSDSPPPGYAPLTWDAVRHLETLGAEFGPHSVSHRIVSRLPEEEVRREIQTSWRRLQQEARNPVPIFAWPTGRAADFSDRDIMLADQCGLHASVATVADYAYFPPHAGVNYRHRINRFGLPTDIATVLRYGSWLERGRQLFSPSS